MTEGQMIYMCIPVSVLSLAVANGIVWFGFVVFRMRIAGRFFDHPFLDELFHRLMNGPLPGIENG